jgi:hypothetical protein
MVAAYYAALSLLKLKNREDPLCETLAKKVIEITRNGERDPPRICARAFRELGFTLSD